MAYRGGVIRLAGRFRPFPSALWGGFFILEAKLKRAPGANIELMPDGLSDEITCLIFWDPFMPDIGCGSVRDGLCGRRAGGQAVFAGWQRLCYTYGKTEGAGGKWDAGFSGGWTGLGRSGKGVGRF
ncbi:hypothetical protein B4135_2421 [Caldibacillus debilis]|uniref:Uncharacterized protein n=1 Tax=Caldibacillus debilis TaxID=301148 RepID=A0A150LZI3_9BACI|nr:hypothetical protein B4135_2421 [Caldibacillus debilis]